MRELSSERERMFLLIKRRYLFGGGRVFGDSFGVFRDGVFG